MPMVKRHLQHIFGRLQRRLTLSYLLVTLLAALALFGHTVWLNAQYMFRVRIAEGYAGTFFSKAEPELLTLFNGSLPDLKGLETWVTRYAEGDKLEITDEDGKKLATLSIRYMAVIDTAGYVVANSPAILDRGPLAPQLPGQAVNDLRQALTGYDLIGSEFSEDNTVLIFTSLRDNNGHIVGVLLCSAETTLHWNYLKPLLGDMFKDAFGRIKLFVWMALLAGLVYGWWISRWLARRLQVLSTSAASWAKGDFSVVVRDSTHDEVGQLGRNLNRMAEELQNLLASRTEFAKLEERNRLARDLHDTVKQQIFAANMQLSSARLLIEQAPEQVVDTLNEALRLNKQALQDLVELIHALRPATLEDKGLAGAIKDYAAQWSRQTGVAVEVLTQNERPLSLRHEQTLYRILREALANVAKHAQAKQVVIHISWAEQAVTVQVIDDGLGFQRDRRNDAGYGLQSMRERLAVLRGEVHVRSAPKQGTHLTVTLPISS